MRKLVLVVGVFVLAGCQSTTQIQGAKSNAKRETLTQELFIQSAVQKPAEPPLYELEIIVPK